MKRRQKVMVVSKSIVAFTLPLVLLALPAVVMRGVIIAYSLSFSPDYPPRLSWNDDPRTTMTVSWDTAVPVVTNLTYTEKGKGNWTYLQTGDRTRHHEIKITELKPGAEYEYKVYTERGWLGPWSFRTAPDGNENFTFAVCGDTRVDYMAYHIDVAKTMAKEENLSFVLDLGDVVISGPDESDWRYFFHAIEPLATHLPYMVAIGNHELYEHAPGENGTHFKGYFALPGNEFYYSFNFANLHITVLNITTDDLYISPEQKEWLINDLSSTNATWKIVAMHVPPYFNKPTAKTLLEIFREYNVDLILAAHDHKYSRYIDGNLTLMVIGGGGARLETYMITGPDTRYAELNFGYVVISIFGDKLYMSAKRVDGTIIDSIVINKSAGVREVEEKNHGLPSLYLISYYALYLLYLIPGVGVFLIYSKTKLLEELPQEVKMAFLCGAYSIMFIGAIYLLYDIVAWSVYLFAVPSFTPYILDPAIIGAIAGATILYVLFSKPDRYRITVLSVSLVSVTTGGGEFLLPFFVSWGAGLLSAVAIMFLLKKTPAPVEVSRRWALILLVILLLSAAEMVLTLYRLSFIRLL